MSSEDNKVEEELVEEAIAADDTQAVEEEIEGSMEGPGGSSDRVESCEAGSDDSETGEDSGETGTEATGADSGRKGFFGKKKDKRDPRDIKIEEMTDRLQRSMAEFDNFRKRTEKEKAAMFEVGAKDIIDKLLPVVDNFERGLAAVPEEEKGTPFAEGMVMIYKQLMKMLEDAGVKPIEAVGQPFDPNFHNAVMHIDDDTVGENIIVQEFQKGYLYRDGVVRHSMVQVAN